MADDKQTIKTLDARCTVLEELVKQLQAKLEELKPRDRGPASTRTMTEEDAIRLITGDLKKVPHKEAAKTLGLSYGQVYSARGGYTFKHIVEGTHKS